MKLDLRFTARPLEDIWCDTLVAFVFQGPVSKGNGVSGLDIKTSGEISRLWEKGFWTGAEGETLLVASQKMIPADRILLKGLGNHSAYCMECLSERVRELADTLVRMKINNLAFKIPLNEEQVSEYASYIKSSCIHLVDSFLEQYENEDDFTLKIVVVLYETFTQDIESMIRELKGHFMAKLDYTIIFDRPDFLPDSDIKKRN